MKAERNIEAGYMRIVTLSVRTKCAVISFALALRCVLIQADFILSPSLRLDPDIYPLAPLNTTTTGALQHIPSAAANLNPH